MDERHINWKFEVSSGRLIMHQGYGRCGPKHCQALPILVKALPSIANSCAPSRRLAIGSQKEDRRLRIGDRRKEKGERRVYTRVSLTTLVRLSTSPRENLQKASHVMPRPASNSSCDTYGESMSMEYQSAGCRVSTVQDLGAKCFGLGS